MMAFYYSIGMVLFLFAAACSSETRQTESTETQDPMSSSFLHESEGEKAQRMEWWKEARFGMFIHWGLYAVPAGTYDGIEVPGTAEWIMTTRDVPIVEYEKFAGEFNPRAYDAEAWVRLAKEAGMKYIVITSKHHDGFGLWDSEVSDWDVVDRTPYGQDLLRPLAEACEAAGIRLCFYHSIMDWHHPDAQAIWEPDYNRGENDTEVNPHFDRYVESYLKPQLRELLTGYGDLGVLWFDGEWIPDYTSEMGKDIYQFVRELQPDIIINNRVDKGRQGMQGFDAEGDFAGDFGTPEQEIPDTGLPGVDWESCMTMNDTWGYNAQDDNWKSDEELIRNLIDIVSKGGNFLLNVGPTAEGRIPEASIERLKAMGKWMSVNSEAIYGAEASPYEKPDWGRYTQKDGVLYVHVFDWPSDGMLDIPLESAQGAELIGGQALDFDTSADGVTLHLPANAPDEIATVIAIRQ